MSALIAESTSSTSSMSPPVKLAQCAGLWKSPAGAVGASAGAPPVVVTGGPEAVDVWAVTSEEAPASTLCI